MRSFHFAILLSAFSFVGCASHGVIVQKESRPHPFYLSVGVEGMYAFVLRDETGMTHRQMVTPEVYGHYAIGDNFNDELPAPRMNAAMEPRRVQVAMYRPAVSVANAPSTTKPQIIVAKSQTATKPTVAQKTTQTSIASNGTKKKAPPAKIASSSHKPAHVAATPAKNSEIISPPSKTSKPWRLGAPNLEMTSGQPSVVITPPGDAPPAPVEIPHPKPTPGETQVDTPHSP